MQLWREKKTHFHAECDEYLNIDLRKARFTQGQGGFTENGNWRCEFSISEEGLAVNLCIWVIGVGVTRGSFYSRPLSDGAVPSHNAVQNTAVVLQEQWHEMKSYKTAYIQEDWKITDKKIKRSQVSRYAVEYTVTIWSMAKADQTWHYKQCSVLRSIAQKINCSPKEYEMKLKKSSAACNSFWRHPVTAGDMGLNYAGLPDH